MRITYLKLKNFIGIHAGTGLTELELDFSNNKNKIIMLLGKNGSGKSTLLSLLTPFRTTSDGRTNLVLEDKMGVKEIHYEKGNDVYKIIHYYSKSKNKSFISKNDIELNESGGVRLFNEILEKEFNINEDYLKIGRLGSDVSSFINYKSTDRKNYMNKFIPSIDEYLEKFKIAREKLAYYDKRLKTLNTSIEKFSSFDSLKEKQNELKNSIIKYEKKFKELEMKRNIIISNIDNKNENIRKILETSELDLDISEIEIEYEKIKVQLNSLNDSLIENFNSIKIEEGNQNFEYSIKSASKLEIASNKNDMLIENYNSKKKELENNNLQLKENISLINEKIKNLNNEYDLEKYDLEDFENGNNLEILNNDKEKLEKINMIKNNDIITRFSMEDLQILNNVFYNDVVNSIISNTENNTIFYELENSESIQLYEFKLKDYERQLEQTEINLNEKFNEISNIKSKKFLLESLKNRPAECLNDSCNFIKDAVMYDTHEFSRLNVLEEELCNLKNEHNNLITRVNTYSEKISVLDKFKELTILINKNLMYVEYIDIIKPKNVSFNNFIFSLFKESSSNLQNIFSLKNELEYYKLKRNIETLNNVIERYDNLVKFQSLYNERLEENQELLESYNLSLEENNKELISIDKELTILINKGKAYNLSLNILNKINGLFDSIKIFNKEEKKMEMIINSTKSEREEIKEFENEIYIIEKEVQNLPNKTNLETELEAVTKNLNIMENLLDEMKTIDENYDNFKLVKDSLDPKIGIPLVFIGNFLKDISFRTNELLDLAYNGSFQIKFDITDSDFFINVFKSDGSNLEDINDASQGETALTSISLSLSMIEKMIKDYNILYLDEIDATLDYNNRRNFIKLIENQIDILGMEQIFIISHNNEFDTYPIDLILLKDHGLDFLNEECKEKEAFLEDKNIIFKLN